MIVNVASKCGYTKRNYEQLVELHKKFKEKGLEILGFPCNQFKKQEPAAEDKIKEGVAKRGVEFDMFTKINVNGKDACPLFKFLKEKTPESNGEDIGWNFVKFLVDKDGVPQKRYKSGINPQVNLISKILVCVI